MKISRKNANRAGMNREKAAGQGMVEFAMILPLLLVLVFGIIEFGRLLFVYSAVLTASREAARYGSAAGDNGSGTLRFMDCSGMIASASRVGVLSNITAVNISYDSGPGTASVSASCPPSSQITGGKHRVVVEVEANYQPIVPLVRVGTLNISSTSARTIYNNIIVGRTISYPVHIADLDGVSSPDGSKWKAQISVKVVDELGAPVADAEVKGRWSFGAPTIFSCTTDASGWCPPPPITKNDIPNGQSNIVFEVVDVFHNEKTYDPTANTDPDAGDEIVISGSYGIRLYKP